MLTPTFPLPEKSQKESYLPLPDGLVNLSFANCLAINLTISSLQMDFKEHAIMIMESSDYFRLKANAPHF